MREVGAGAVQHEHIGEARHRDAEMRAGIVVAPEVADCLPVASLDMHRPEHFLGDETGRQDDQIGLVPCAVFRDDGVFFDAVDRIVGQGDVGAGQGFVPVVIPQHALAVRRIWRHHLRQQFGVIADLRFDIGRDIVPELLVGGVQRPVRGGPVGVHVQRWVQPIGRRPHQLETVPFRIERDMLQRRHFSRADSSVIVGVRHCPMRRTLKNREVLDIWGDGGADLHAAGAGADHRDAFSRKVLGIVPARGVEYRAGELVQAFYVGDRGPVELSDGTDQRIRSQAFRGAIGRADSDVPVGRGFVIDGRCYLGIEADVATDIVFVRHTLHIRPQLIAFRKMLGPVVVRFE